MPKRRPQRRRKKKQPNEVTGLTPQQRTAEFFTVGWMLSTLATAMAEVVGLVSKFTLAWSDAKWPEQVQALPDLMLVVACLSGTVGLILCGITSKIRQVPAPRAVTQGSIFICLLPWMVITARSLAG